jgi:hypothetical protein
MDGSFVLPRHLARTGPACPPSVVSGGRLHAACGVRSSVASSSVAAPFVVEGWCLVFAAEPVGEWRQDKLPRRE